MLENSKCPVLCLFQDIYITKAIIGIKQKKNALDTYLESHKQIKILGITNK